MKIAYLKRTSHNSGGTERVVFNKTNYLVERGYDVTLITTESAGKPDFFPFSERLRRFDLAVNYSEIVSKPIYQRVPLYIYKNFIHKRRLKKILLRERFDIVVSMFGNEIYWINDIKDGSKKINEVHFSRYFRTLMNNGNDNLLNRAISFVKNRKDITAIPKFDLFAVLTNEDRPKWGTFPNLRTIYNSVTIPETSAKLTNKRAIAVGRPSYIKGFDLLVDAWAKVYKQHPDWIVDIYLSGEDEKELLSQITALGLQDVIKIHPPTPEIIKRITESSIYLMTSRYEGLPMVLLEAASCGVPSVSFECKCGPRDIITDGRDGLLVQQGDIETFAQKVCQLIEDEPLRIEMGKNARKNAKDRFSEEVVMQQWEELFKELVSKK